MINNVSNDYKLGYAHGYAECATDFELISVIRCKDCAYATDPNEGYVYCTVNERCFKFDDFCSYGERKERDHYGELTVEDYLK